MMKRLLIYFFFLLLISPSFAQSRYVSSSRMGQEDRNVNEQSGVIILSKISNLVVSVTNATNYKIDPCGKCSSGLYEYKIYIDPNETNNPKIEVSKMGDINKVSFVVNLHANILKAYKVEEVEKPITMENITSANDAILDASLAEVEISSAIDELTVVCSPLLNANITKSKKKTDASISITSIKLPINNIIEANNKVVNLEAEYKALSKKLLEDKKGNDSDFDRLDALEEEINEAKKNLSSITTVELYTSSSNHLTIDISNLKPRTKMCYGVLLLKTIIREHVSKCSGMLEEGGRLFALRKYEDAKRSFSNALTQTDTPNGLIPVIKSNIAQCDSCILYERLVIASLMKIKELKDKGNVTQSNIADYYSAAVDFMKIIQKYNPCEYYDKSINTLEDFIVNMPFQMRFTIVSLLGDRISVGEGAPLADVELWGYYGKEVPYVNSYSNDRKFRNTIKASHDYKLLGTTSANGIIDLELVRKELPSGFYFRPIGKSLDADIKIVYKDVQDVMREAKGEFKKRQFRLKMYRK